MSITDELRDCIRTASRSYEDARNPYNDREILHIPEEELLAIADRIDAEHKAKVDEAYENGERDECADWLDETDGGYVKLPVDADGVIIHVGDMMEERSGHTFEVASLMAFGGSDNWLVLSDARNFSSFREPHDLRHHHAPTVEDVLREFFSRYVTTKPKDEDDAIIAEYAAKLRLAKEGE